MGVRLDLQPDFLPPELNPDRWPRRTDAAGHRPARGKVNESAAQAQARRAKGQNRQPEGTPDARNRGPTAGKRTRHRYRNVPATATGTADKALEKEEHFPPMTLDHCGSKIPAALASLLQLPSF
jgi:hypothetical protein